MPPPQDTVQRGPPQTRTGGVSSPRSSRVQQVSPATGVSARLRLSNSFPNMDTSVLVSLLALVVAMAGVTRALHIQGSLEKDDLLPRSEEKMADSLLEMVKL